MSEFSTSSGADYYTPRESASEWSQSSSLRSNLSDENYDPTSDCLSLIDLETLSRIQHGIGYDGVGYSLGTSSSVGDVLLGSGLSYNVRRVTRSHMYIQNVPLLYGDGAKHFYVVKQPKIAGPAPVDSAALQRRLYAVMLELRILSHAPVHQHRKIVKLVHVMWDTSTVIAPSLILEYADLGTLEDFQDPDELSLAADTKLGICRDVAEGLSFLHKCGIIHGDVKSSNVLLFWEENPVRESRNGTNILQRFRTLVTTLQRASVCIKCISADMHLGSSLIEIFDSARRQKILAETEPWDAPELNGVLGHHPFMEPLELRRTDIYSYGMLVWRIMCNGKPPYSCISWQGGRAQIAAHPPALGSNTAVSVGDFRQLKAAGKPLLDAALDTLRNKSSTDVPAAEAREVLTVTLQVDPTERAAAMDEIVDILCSESRQQEPSPEVLRRGDFGISNHTLPVMIYGLRTAPSIFRSIIYDQLAEAAEATRPPAFRALALLVIAICYEQGLFRGIEQAQTPHNKPTIEALQEASRLGNPYAQSLIAPLACAHGFDGDIDGSQLKGWLSSAARRGSIRARYELMKRFGEGYTEMKEAVQRARAQVGSGITAASNAPVSHANIGGLAIADEAGWSAVSRPGLTRLHQASFLGSVPVCKELLAADGNNELVNIGSATGETPLHFAAWGGQLDVLRLLIELGADVNARSAGGFTPLHHSLLSLDPIPTSSLLLSKGADPNLASAASLDEVSGVSNHFGLILGTPLDFAVSMGDVELSNVLLKAGSHPHRRSSEQLTSPELAVRMTPLELALRMHSEPLLHLLLSYAIRDGDNLPNPNSLYPYMTGYYSPPLLRRLQWGGKDPSHFVEQAAECFDRHGIPMEDRGILSWGLDANEPSIVDSYLGKLQNSEGEDSLAPHRFRFALGGKIVEVPFSPDLGAILSNAITQSSPEVILIILRHMPSQPRPLAVAAPGVSPPLCTLGRRSLSHASEFRTIVTALVSAGADISAVEEDGAGPLARAVKRSNFQALDALLEHGPFPMADVQNAAASCVAGSTAASRITGLTGSPAAGAAMLRALFGRYPRLLVPPPPMPPPPRPPPGERDDVGRPTSGSVRGFGPMLNFLRILAGEPEYGRDDAASGRLVRDVVQRVQGLRPDGAAVLRRLLDDDEGGTSWMLHTPLHAAAAAGNVEAAAALLDAGASVNHCARADELLAPLPQSLGRGGSGVVVSARDADPFLSAGELGFADEIAKILRSVALDGDPLVDAAMRGPTPLDVALDRDWSKTLSLWPSDQRPLLRALRSAGGARREEKTFNARTRAVVELLKSKGAKTKDELLGIPALIREANEKAREARKLQPPQAETSQPGPPKTKVPENIVRMQVENSGIPKAKSEAHARITLLWDAAVLLPSWPLTEARWPGLLRSASSQGPPPLSALVAEVADRFARLLSAGRGIGPTTGTGLGKAGRDGLRMRLAEFEAWEARNGAGPVERGRGAVLDELTYLRFDCSDVLLLVAGVVACLAETTRVLELMEELLARHKVKERIDFRHRHEELLDDLDKGLGPLVHEETTIKALYEAAYEEFYRDVRQLGSNYLFPRGSSSKTTVSSDFASS